jgi:MFS family permease
MTIGGLIMGVYDSYALSIVGRLMSGVGAILLNVLLTKMIADWFAGKEIITAMAVLMSSWPFGISLGLLSLGRLATITSWQLVMYLTAAACLIALILVATLYRVPPITNEKRATESMKVKLSRQEIWLVLMASLIWTLFNVGFIALPSFAPDLFTSIGYSVPAAGSLVSMVTWIVIPSVQLGGYISEKIGRPNIILVACFSGIGLGMCLLPYWPYPVVLFILLGFIFGPPVGIMMALPTEVLHPENRAVGMGLFWTFFYGGMSVLTTLTGLSRDLTQSPAAPLVFGGMLLITAIIIFAIFRMFQSRVNLIALEGNEI